MRHIIFVCLLMLPLAFAQADSAPANSARQLATITVGEANALIQQHKQNEQFVILDVRTPDEFAQGHLHNAKLINYRAADFSDQLNALDKSKTYLIYCRSGGRSAGALRMMDQQGFSSVYNMDGGFTEWDQAALPSTR